MVARTYMNAKGMEGLIATVPKAQVQAFACKELNALQEQSFAKDLELCGDVFETSAGELGVLRPCPGDQASCDIAYFDQRGMVLVASFHMHGKHSN